MPGTQIRHPAAAVFGHHRVRAAGEPVDFAVLDVRGLVHGDGPRLVQHRGDAVARDQEDVAVVDGVPGLERS